ncbi:MAG TPA: SDR family oxidoreductase [Candidatus Hydrogenedentes bacterium]|nr:SDR family oxidoreductase [Candidatus Hydrogenedentota bacterium]HOV72989.1 SDR family oxidoreductase [Candidatus Hydrogenedentota bacterium]HPC15835.1 SDR family oxidoreductase [Candidatus Hydrogenedentota bacterium]HRT19756.1 SDR family oxidoreductase [Candidatus Hydrogenedentota bacterium]HRT64530.1 SDR family oxidoreductase [Candidatus Hydrogenedentota bacterium]
MALQDTVALITGAGRGIGRGIALAFARQGCDIAAIARTAREIEETADAVRRLGRRARAIVCDVTSARGVSEAVRMAECELGPIDILVNNAGYGSFKPFIETDEASWRRTLDVNLTGPFLCIQAVLPGMMARRRGRIINISSVAGLKPIAEQAAYCASKHGLNGLTKVLAMELRPYGIGVHAICPGGVDTQLARENMPDRDKTNWLQPEDIAHVALFLATQSPRAATDEIVVRRFDSVPIGG